MILFTRCSVRGVIIESERPYEIRAMLLSLNDSQEACPWDMFDERCDCDTLVYISCPQDSPSCSDPPRAVAVHLEPDAILAALFNSPVSGLVGRVRLTPGMIIIRTPGQQYHTVMDKLAAEFGGAVSNLKDELGRLTLHKGPMIAFTPEPLSGPVPFGNFHPEVLLAPPINRAELLRHVTLRVEHYINETLENQEWRILEIRMFDQWERYDLHRERLGLIMGAMEAGFLIGQGWTSDFPRFMMEVTVYRVRTVTFMEPLRLKKILMGLEYDSRGDRVCDFDLYMGKKKVSWVDTRPHKGKSGRAEAAISYRGLLDRFLSPKITEKLDTMETELRELAK